MVSGLIEDWQIAASSSYPQEWDAGCHERYARLYRENGLGWCAKYKSASEWLRIDLGVPATVGAPRANIERGERANRGWSRFLLSRHTRHQTFARSGNGSSVAASQPAVEGQQIS